MDTFQQPKVTLVNSQGTRNMLSLATKTKEGEVSVRIFTYCTVDGRF